MAHLAIENLTFAYAVSPDKPVLDGVSLELEPNRIYGFVGKTAREKRCCFGRYAG